MAEEEEQWEEEVVTLQGRRPRHRNNNTTTATGNGSILLKADNGTGSLNEEAEEEDGKELNNNSNNNNIVVVDKGNDAAAAAGVAEIQGVGEGEGRLEKSVYFDKDGGIETTNRFSEMKCSPVECSVSETNPGDEELDVAVKNFDIQKSLSTVVNYKEDENLRDENLSRFNLPPFGKSREEPNTHFKHFNNGTKEHGDVNLLKDSEQEVTELDVERVLEKQDTHDLYCPNCNSCITRRVILRKRKRKIQNIRYDAKREKFEPVVGSGLDASPANAANDHGHDTVDKALDGSLTPVANDFDRDSEPDIFRCLSCFSFFIPTGNGLKLFRIFGDRSEDENMQNPRQIPAATTNKFFSIFARKVAIEQGNDHRQHVEEHDVVNPSYNLNGTLPDQNGHAPSLQGAPLLVQSFSVGRLVNDATTKPPEAEKDIVASSKQGPIVLENVREKSDDEMKKSDTGEWHMHDKLKVSADILCETEKNVVVTSTPAAALLTGSMIEIEVKLDDEAKRNNDKGACQFEISEDTSPKKGVNIHEGEPLKDDRDALIPLIQDALLLPDKEVDIGKDLKGMPVKSSAGEDVILLVEAEPVEPRASQGAQNINISTERGSLPESEIYVGERKGAEASEVREWDILKSIVYGGLIESITSLGVVSSAAGADAATLNVLALGLANLIGGLFVIGHDLRELNNDHSGGASDQIHGLDRYQETLGRRENFLLHAIVAMLSYLIFGLVPPVTYGFSFRKSDNRELKITAVMATSLLCIIILAIGKGRIRKPPKSYFKTVVYYVSIWLTVSGVSYIVGYLIKRLLEKLGWFESSVVVTMPLLEARSTKPAWGSY